MKRLRFAFMGFRHGHIFDVYKRLQADSESEIVAACEEDASTRRALSEAGQVTITHSSYDDMLENVPFDVLAVGDYYGRRGSILIDALRHGKHVICDKPICTSLQELDVISDLVRARSLRIGCQLDLRDSGLFQELRRLIRDGVIGEIQAISFNGEHPLRWGSRPAWYFEEGKHGGTLNDIAIHAIDAVPWMTGLRFATANAARTWHARPAEAPHFMDCAQVMMTMSNGCGVLGDVSYLAPDDIGYGIPQYWQFRFWGTRGLLENNLLAKEITLYPQSGKQARVFTPGDGTPGGYLKAFVSEVRGETASLSLTSAEILAASRTVLRVQQAADLGWTNVTLA